MRLSSKLFVALAVLAGSVFGFAPSASAHKNTGTISEVTGTVSWPEGSKASFNVVTPGGRTVLIPTGLSLDSRAGTTTPLNGCRLAGGNSGAGLPVGQISASNPPTLVSTFTSSDLCFSFEGLEIHAAGLWDGLNHATVFSCDATGTSGASGNDKPTPTGESDKPLQEIALGPTFGAFYGEFGCDGALELPDPILGLKPGVSRADGHFHGMTVGSTTIGFLGEVHCTGPNPSAGTVCPLANPDNMTNEANGGHATPPRTPAEDHNESRIKHTLACKGEVVPLVPFNTKFPGTLPPGDTIATAQVNLECTMA